MQLPGAVMGDTSKGGVRAMRARREKGFLWWCCIGYYKQKQSSSTSGGICPSPSSRSVCTVGTNLAINIPIEKESVAKTQSCSNSPINSPMVMHKPV